MRASKTLRATRQTLGAAFEAIRPRLDLVEQFIERQLLGSPEIVQQAGRYVFKGGGERLRPALLLVAARLAGCQDDRDIRYGAVIEMIHTATLVHDDIIDHASVRRGRATANDRWGNQLTVLLGDWLYIRSTELALELGDTEVLRVLSRATVEMVEGEILALEILGKDDVTYEQYLEIVRRKTAELFAAACSLPALFPAAPARTSRLSPSTVETSGSASRSSMTCSTSPLPRITWGSRSFPTFARASSHCRSSCSSRAWPARSEAPWRTS
ncbi:MAG: polyprenyl synthetase family protein [Acidobacteriota bacterium]